MRKILYLVSTLEKSGPVIVLANIIKYLDRNEFEPIVLTLSPEPKNSMKTYFTDILHTKVETLGLSRVKGFFFAKSHVKGFIKDNSIDIVHSHGFRADGLMSKIAGISSVSTLHNYPYYDYPMTYGKILGTIMASLHLKFLKKLSRPLACSKSISSMLKIHNYTIGYVQNGVDTQRFENLNKAYLREKLQITQDTKVFISVGHLSDRKDPLLVIEAFKTANIQNAKLLLLGDGHLKQKCKDAIGQDESIKLVGKVDNVHEYLGASDYFISASLAEGLPNSVLEAMACGLPCVLSSIPPHEEIHEINKDSSLLFKTKDLQGLSDRLKEIVNRDYITMSRASKEIAYNHLNAQIMSKNYQNIYKELIN